MVMEVFGVGCPGGFATQLVEVHENGEVVT